MTLKLYLFSDPDLDSYFFTDFVVAVPNKAAAAHTHPNGCQWDHVNAQWADPFVGGTWTTPSKVKVTFVGRAGKGVKRGPVLASFRAG